MKVAVGDTLISDLSAEDCERVRRLAFLELTTILETFELPVKIRKTPKRKYKGTQISRPFLIFSSISNSCRNGNIWRTPNDVDGARQAAGPDGEDTFIFTRGNPKRLHSLDISFLDRFLFMFRLLYSWKKTVGSYVSPFSSLQMVVRTRVSVIGIEEEGILRIPGATARIRVSFPSPATFSHTAHSWVLPSKLRKKFCFPWLLLHLIN